MTTIQKMRKSNIEVNLYYTIHDIKKYQEMASNSMTTKEELESLIIFSYAIKEELLKLDKLLY